MRKYFRKSMAVVLAFILCLSNIMIGAYATNSIPTVKYSDVQEDSWYYDAVNFVTAQGFMEGTDTGAFLPENSLTRSQFAKILYNMEGNPEAGNASTFTDVPTGKWYTDAVTWASNAGLVRGVGNGAFLPDESIRRQDLIVMTYRYAQYKECEITKRADLSSYQDAKNVAEYALDAVQWAVAEGIIVGSAGQLSPDREIQRCEAAELLMRLAEFITPSETEPTQPSENPSPVPGVPEEPDNPETDEVNLNEYGLAEEVEDGTILHAWCWNFNTIKEMIPQIAAAGFSAVQTSPINAIIEGENGGLQIYGSGKWYYHYQPTEYSEIGNYQLGTDEEFREMCEVAHQYGVKVIVDQVLNHMTSSESAISDTIKSEIDWGDAGEWGNPEKPWTHKSTGTQWSEEDRFEETQNSLSGLIEWNTQNENVQQYLLKWLETCVEAGADGFRYDAAKLIELPDDVSIKYPEYQFSSDFWPTVLQNGSSFQYGEVLQEGEPNHVYSSDLEGGYNDQDSSRLGNYQSQTFIAADGEEENMRTTLSFYGFRLRDAISNGNVNADFVGDMLVPEGASADRTVTWVESHDNYCNNASYSQLNEQQVIQAWAILAARKDGTPLFFSRPNNSSASNPWGDNQIGPEGSHFFMDAQVVAVNFFHNEMGNQDEYLSNPTGSDKVVMIERGTAGAVIVNLLGEDLVLDEAPVQSMADGTYTDQVYGSTFTVSNGKISGTVKAGKVAVVYNSKVDTPLEFKPEISLSVPTGDYLTDTMDVSVSIRGIDHATYQIDDGEEIPVANGDVITIGEDAQVDEAVTLKILGYSAAGELVAQASATYTKRLYKADTVVYIDDALCKARGWDQAYVYIWVNVDGSTLSNQGWPGTKAVLETEGQWAGYWKYVVPYELESISNLHVIVHGNKGDQIETNKMLISPGETKVLDADENWVDGASVQIPEVSLNEYGLAEKVEDGTILHAWCWNFNTIKEMIPQIAAAGFSAVQTSPINAIIEGENGGLQIYGSGKWYYHYQPTEYSEIGNYQLGTDEEFREMCEVAHQYGVKVIVDQVLNHMTSSESAISDTIKSEIDWGDAGEWGNPEKPWTHKSTGTQWSEEDRFEETQNSLSGLIEWNTQNENVQQYLLKWLETCVEAGADGFRYDAAKLIELPDDVSIKYPEYQFSSDFWPTVLQNGSSFQYGEVLQEGEPNHVYSSDLEGGYNDQDSSRLGNYQSQTFIAADGEEENMRTTLSFYGFRLRDAISNGNVNADFVGDMLVPEGASADRTVTWVESHDNYCNNASYSQLNEQQVIQAWAILAARKDGTPLFFSRPNNSSASNPWGDNQIGPEGSHFFMDAQVVAVNFFHNEMGNQDEYLSNPTGSDKVVMIERGTAGAVIVNLLGEDLVLDEAPVQSMADGTYTDQVYGSTFTVSNGKISGTVKAGKVAVVYNSKVDTPLEFKPEISLSVPTGDYLTDTMDVSVSIRGIDHATYQIDDGEEIPVANGDVITIGEDAQVDEAVTLKILGYSAAGELVAQASATYTKRLYKADTVVYIDDALCKARGWDQAYVYIWVNVDGSTLSNQGWPGTKAVLETEGQWAGYWKYVVPYELESISNLHVIVHGNKGDQIETNKMLISPGETKVLDADENWVDGSEVVNTGKVYALPGSGTEFYENTLNVTLHATNVTNASYRVGDSGEWMPFEDGQIITIGEDAADKENITVFMKGTNSDGSTVEESAVYIKHFIADKEEINVLFIGNSYTYYNDGIWSHFQKLAYEAGYNVQVDSVTIGSHHLYEFADPDEADPNGGPLVEEKLSTNHYDYVFLQEHSTYPITNYDTFASAATTLYNRIMEHNAECTVILYQTWGRETGSSNLTQDGRGWTNATMTYDLEYAYEKLGETLNVPVSPAGTAFHDVYVNNGSKIDLYDADQTHPTLEGTYLAALVHIGTVFGSDAIEAATAYTAGLPADTVQILKQAAIDAPEKAQAPHLYLTPAAEETTMDEAGLTLTLHAVNVARATYQINDGEEIEYVYGDKLTITPDEIINGKVTVTLKGENDAQEPVPILYLFHCGCGALFGVGLVR